MACTSGTSTSLDPSTSDGSILRFEPPTTKLPFKSDKRYHVFLSFRGPDVRKTLVDHLFEALSVAGLNVFLDTERLEKGEIIGLSLEGAIESSDICIPIFSKGYAESAWCLREAAAMVRTNGLIIPLFYDVEPTHVRYPEKENCPYFQSFEKHRCKSYYGKEEIDRWIEVLHQICDRSGWTMDMADGSQVRMVKKMVNDLIGTLDRVPLKVAEHPVGLDTVKDALVQKLNLNSSDEVLKVGIWGVGGIGKTTFAKAVYNQIYLEFEAASFISNIRTTATESPNGLSKLQKIILKDLSGYDREVDSVDKGISLFNNLLRGKRVLLVLDDVDARKQLKALVGDWLAPGSRVILTSRDKHIFNIAQTEFIHEMSGLEINEGLQLLSWYAFLRASPNPNYDDLSKRIVEACKGHPLSLEVIGSFLYDKHDDTSCWKEALHNITCNSEIYDILYISYNALGAEEKEIFLDIACFFIGEEKSQPIVLWESLYKKVHTAISNLSMKLLIKIDDKGLFDMHDHLRDMGRAIAQKEKMGTRKWEPADLSTASNDLSHLRLIGGNPQSLEMLYTDTLRYLHLENLTVECMTKDPLSMLPRSLIWLCLKNCSFEVRMNRPVKKQRMLRSSRIVDNIWQCRILQIKSCPGSELLISPLVSIPQLTHSITNLRQLQILDLEGCESLSSLPDSIGDLSQLQDLNLGGCESLGSLPDSIGDLSQLQDLNFGGCGSLSSLPDSIGNLSQLQDLNLGGCESLSSLPDSIGNLSQLHSLHLSWCENLSSLLPESIGKLSQLKHLDLGGCTSVSSILESIGNLSQLQHLDLGWCDSLSSIPDSIGNLSQLQYLNLYRCKSLNNLPNSIGNLFQLQDLNLGWCESLSSLPDSIGDLSQLHNLHLSECKSLSSLSDSIGKLSQLKHLDLGWCDSLSSLPDIINNLSQLQHLQLQGCRSLSSLPHSIGDLSQLKHLDLGGCGSLSSLPHSIGKLSQLQHLDLQRCLSLSSLPDSFGKLSQLKYLDFRMCESLSSLPHSIGQLSKLKHLDLEYCLSLTSLPRSIGKLSQLKHLDLEHCSSLTSLPDSIINLSQLQHLDLRGCDSLRDLPDIIGKLSDKILNLEWGMSL